MSKLPDSFWDDLGRAAPAGQEKSIVSCPILAMESWQSRLHVCIEHGADCYSALLFLPCKSARLWLDRIALKYPSVLAQLHQSIADAQGRQAEYVDGCDNAENNLLTAIESLHGRVSSLVELLVADGLVRKLNDSDQCVLLAMLGKQAFPHSPMSGQQIVEMALGGGDHKRKFRKLKQLGLVESQEGRGNGYWLTDLGRQVATAIEIASSPP